ncbi:hypothetical protein D3C71_899270 [compost metagenome]
MKSFSDNVHAFGHLMVQTMGFQEFQRDATGEVYWQTSIPRTPYSIQVRSGMKPDNTYTPAPDIGIRVYLIDTVTHASIVPHIRVRRTEHSLRNVREKVGILWKYAASLQAKKSPFKAVRHG